MAMGLAAADEATVARVAAAGRAAYARNMEEMHRPRNERIRRLRAEGKSYAAIAEEVGLTRQRVAQILTA